MTKSEKEVKRVFLAKTAINPENYFPTKTLEELNFSRYKCASCERFFWSHHKQEVCGDPACSGGFRFIGKKPTKKQLGYIAAWQEYKRIHERLGYKAIDRYPVVARWNPTTDFTIASIAAFQPYVVSGEIAPPANPLIIPQLCLRFPDIDNVGITGHFVGFVMLGEHAFLPPDEYDPNRFLKDHVTWLREGMGVALKDLTIHEDVWEGGGNLGPSLEFFSHGLELSNQVYMQYEILPDGDLRELSIKVLDMGQGLERVAWFTNGGASIYEYVFPPVMKRLREMTGIGYDGAFMKKFTPLSSYLNADEVENMDAAWRYVAKEMVMPLEQVQEKILPQAALYAVAEHSRALLFAITDGALPSNVGGMYNLRVILRRALGFIDKYGWDIDFAEVCAWHADYLQPLFPELMESLDQVRDILAVETQKYRETMKKTQAMIPKLLKKELSPEDFVRVYDSQGITPEMIHDAAVRAGKTVKVPDSFYAMVAERHEAPRAVTKTEREHHLPIDELPATEVLYFDDYTHIAFDARVLAIIGEFVVLDKTAFYPTSGGQLHDTGMIAGELVVDVFKQGPHVVHVLEGKPKFHANDTVHGEVDFDRRMQLAQHHTATHIVNAAARRVLGKHVNQASAKKDMEKAHLDITHYGAVTDEQVQQIEKEANRIVQEGIETKLSFMPREQAEQEFGMLIYQGGAVPGKTLRIVQIGDVDIEACGGTHLKNTLDAGEIVLLKASKVQDGVVRLTFAAGRSAQNYKRRQQERLDRLASLLKCAHEQIPGRAEELFVLWKDAKKKKKRGEQVPVLQLSSVDEFEGDVLQRVAELLRTQPEHVEKTIERFLNDLGSGE